MKKFLVNLLCLVVIFFGVAFLYSYLEKNKVIDTLLEYYKREHTTLVNNNYSGSTENKLVQITNNFEPKNRQDILNIYYTVFSSGMNDFTFYCAREYTNCIDDIQEITNDNVLLSNINNFVKPFNSYKSVRTEYTTGGKVTIEITKVYTDDMIKAITNKIDELYPQLVSPNKSVRDNIMSVHDYIINHTQYDTNYVLNSADAINPYQSNNAYGPLFQGYAICSGYTDLMSLFLDRMGVPNHKVSNEKHVWNLVYLDGQWLHLDLTWDDPVTPDGRARLDHYFFLVTTDELEELDRKLDTTDHVFDESVYLH